MLYHDHEKSRCLPALQVPLLFHHPIIFNNTSIYLFDVFLVLSFFVVKLLYNLLCFSFVSLSVSSQSVCNVMEKCDWFSRLPFQTADILSDDSYDLCAFSVYIRLSVVHV